MVSGLTFRSLVHFSLGNLIRLPLMVILLLTHLLSKLFFGFLLVLNFGNPWLLPFLISLKKFWYALSKSSIVACKQVESTSLSHSYSFFLIA